MNHYGRRDIESLGEYYTRHVAAMTREQLCSKSDIAAELAYRDKLIDELSGHLQKGDKDEKNPGDIAGMDGDRPVPDTRLDAMRPGCQRSCADKTGG